MVGWTLVVTFVLMPILKLNGYPLILLNFPDREFHLFGATFLPTDTFFLMLLLLCLLQVSTFRLHETVRVWDKRRR